MAGRSTGHGSTSWAPHRYGEDIVKDVRDEAHAQRLPNAPLFPPGTLLIAWNAVASRCLSGVSKIRLRSNAARTGIACTSGRCDAWTLARARIHKHAHSQSYSGFALEGERAPWLGEFLGARSPTQSTVGQHLCKPSSEDCVDTARHTDTIRRQPLTRAHEHRTSRDQKLSVVDDHSSGASQASHVHIRTTHEARSTSRSSTPATSTRTSAHLTGASNKGMSYANMYALDTQT